MSDFLVLSYPLEMMYLRKELVLRSRQAKMFP